MFNTVKAKLRGALGFLWIFFLTAGFLITSSWTADILQRLIEDKDPWYQENWYLSLVYFGSWLLFTIGLYHSRNHFIPTKTLYETRPTAHKVLIMLVSTPSLKVAFDNHILRLTDGKTEIKCAISDDLDEMIEHIKEFAGSWNWRQNMRSLAVHQQKLEKVILIGSVDDKGKGSVENLDEMTALLKPYAPKAEFHDNRESPCNFNQLEELRNTIVKWANEMVKQGYQQKDIIVDVTSGTKTASIAAALATLILKDVEFQYIPNPSSDPQAYNVVVTSQARLE